MKVTISTKLGGFEFDLSQASIIYLLSLAQDLQDEGGPQRERNKEPDQEEKERNGKNSFVYRK